MSSAASRSGVIHVNGVDLAIEEFGSVDAPAIVLVAGAASAMDWWDRLLCERIAAGDAGSGPRRVIRYDLRDTGASTTLPVGKADYTGSDLVDDLAALIEHLHAAPAHVVGLSLGGGLAQQLALRRPELLATMTLMSTSPSGPGSSRGADLPPPSPELSASFSQDSAPPDWDDPDAVSKFFIDTERLFGGEIPLDEDRIAAIGADIVRRSTDPSAGDNHWMVDEGENMRDDIESIRVPTLVMHGTADPLFPYPHAELLVSLIPDARLVPIPGMGHQFPPPPTWDLVVTEILSHTARES